MEFLNKYLEAAAILILVFLVVSHADGFASAVYSLSSANIGAVKSLQGR